MPGIHLNRKTFSLNFLLPLGRSSTIPSTRFRAISADDLKMRVPGVRRQYVATASLPLEKVARAFLPVIIAGRNARTTLGRPNTTATPVGVL